jgi:4-aminobutyrate aminotransferase-like enzyme
MENSKEDMLARRHAAMGPAYRLFYDNPVHFVRGDDVWLFDADGRRYLDMYNNVAHVGHCNSHVADAICRQVRTLNTHTRYLHENIINLAERLTAKLPEALDTAMFCCTGSEANELALRIARSVTGGDGLIVMASAYHGNSQATYEISTEDIPAAEVPDYVVTVPAPDTYRGLYRDEDAALHYATHVSAAIETLRSRDIRPAAFITDTIMSSSGVVAPPLGYLKKAAEIVRHAGALFIADEVQAGFARTGKSFWGFEADDVQPDIVTMGKPMGNGHPIAAVVTRRDFAQAFSHSAHYFNTFGGNPVSCAAGLAVLDVIESENLQQSSNTVGTRIVNGLQALAGNHECIGDIRGHGLFLALELVADRGKRTPASALTARVIEELRNRQVISGFIGPDANIIKLRPPMTLTVEHVDLLLETLDASLTAAIETIQT